MKQRKSKGLYNPWAAHGPIGHVCTTRQKESIRHTPPRQLSSYNHYIHSTTANNTQRSSNTTTALYMTHGDDKGRPRRCDCIVWGLVCSFFLFDSLLTNVFIVVFRFLLPHRQHTTTAHIAAAAHDMYNDDKGKPRRCGCIVWAMVCFLF